MSNPWRDWPPHWLFFLVYAGVNANVSGLSTIIGAQILTSVGYEEFEPLTGGEGWKYGALWGTLQASMMGTLFWPCSMSLNVNERARVAQQGSIGRNCANFATLLFANLLSLVAASYLLGKEKEMGKALICQFSTPIAVLVFFCQFGRLLVNRPAWQPQIDQQALPDTPSTNNTPRAPV